MSVRTVRSLLKVRKQVIPDSRVFLKEYKPFPFRVNNVALLFDIRSKSEVFVTSTVEYEAAHPELYEPFLVLNAEGFKLVSVELDGACLEGHYDFAENILSIHSPPLKKPFVLTTTTRLDPTTNISCSGLYMSGPTLLTQCEAEGFRHITAFPDRPDVLTTYTVTIRSHIAELPVLLSNGNLISESHSGQVHEVTYHDPFPKPSYLFAVVCGDLVKRETCFVTRSGRPVSVQVWTKQSDFHKSVFALESVIRAMKWDETTFNREYDLDVYHIVSVDAFNFGAMENKGLNVFSSTYILASPETSTDARIADVDATIAHEYFHNWSGNRVTLRDWFGISLKEGLTTFREQEFCKDHHGAEVSEISFARYMIESQFLEDSGQMAHPVRPEFYEAIDNFYTLTVYQKGACVIRMIETVIGKEGFRKGLDIFFDRHDGQAVTSEDLLKAIEDANSVDLNSFLLWYSQAGTPIVTVEHLFDEDNKSLTIKLNQSIPVTAGDLSKDEKKPMPIPVNIAIFDRNGQKVIPKKMSCNGVTVSVCDNILCLLTEKKNTFVFNDIDSVNAISVLRKFSAPVKVEYPQQGITDLLFLLKYETDGFSRFMAAKTALQAAILKAINEHSNRAQLDPLLIDGLRAVLIDEKCNRSLKSEILSCIPSVSEVASLRKSSNPLHLYSLLKDLSMQIGSELQNEIRFAYDKLLSSSPLAYEFEESQVAYRALKNTLLSYLVDLGDKQTALIALRSSNNFTDTLGALYALNDSDCEERSEVICSIKKKFENDPQVMRSLLRAICSSNIDQNLENVKSAMMDKSLYDASNPESIRGAICGFISSVPNFHKEDGSGYEFVSESIIEVDKFNPIAASQICDSAFSDWLSFDEICQIRIKGILDGLMSRENLSKQTKEVLKRALASTESED